MIPRIRTIAELTKWRISLFASLSVAAGFILAGQEISKPMILPVIGVFLLACGACALNQYQERKIDGLMERTKGRPLPSGKLSPCAALEAASGLSFLGAFILFYGSGWLAGVLGLLAILWYNGVYTNLKRKTAFAAVPGALVGTIPPALGWLAGDGSLLDRRIGIIAFFFFMWQVPHFWLLVLHSVEDYERAGLPSLRNKFSAPQMKRIVFIWTLSAAISSLLIPCFGLVTFPVIYLLFLAMTLWIVWNTMTFFRNPLDRGCPRLSFARLNVYTLFIMSLLSLDKVLISNHAQLTLITKVLAMIGFKPV